MSEWLRGRLIVATPAMLDPNFSRTVVLLLDHDEDGALGLVLNRATEVPVEEVLPGWGGVVDPPAVLFGGGPVEPGAVIGLGRARSDSGPREWEPIVGRLRAVDPTMDPALVPTEVDAVRIFAGYAGWSPGQLEAELEQDAWFVLDSDAEHDPFSDEPDNLWNRVFARQTGELRLLTTYPDDPSMN
jgi:putative transcriptional regulator